MPAGLRLLAPFGRCAVEAQFIAAARDSRIVGPMGPSLPRVCLTVDLDWAPELVADAAYFIDGYGITDGDVIQLEGQTQTSRITGIDYAANRLTLDTPLTWTAGKGVALSYTGSVPDIGAYERPCPTERIQCPLLFEDGSSGRRRGLHERVVLPQPIMELTDSGRPRDR